MRLESGELWTSSLDKLDASHAPRNAMIRNSSFRALRSAYRAPPHILRPGHKRHFSVKRDDVKPETSEKIRSRILHLTQRLPKFLQRYTTPLVQAPVTHISAFLILHELTAVVPLVGLAATFHYTQWLPAFAEGKIVSEGVKKFGNYFRKKGWLGHEKTRRYRWWGVGEGGTRLVVEYVSTLCPRDRSKPILA